MRSRPIYLKTSALRGTSFLSVEPGTRLKSFLSIPTARFVPREAGFSVPCRGATTKPRDLATLQKARGRFIARPIVSAGLAGLVALVCWVNWPSAWREASRPVSGVGLILGRVAYQ